MRPHAFILSLLLAVAGVFSAAAAQETAFVNAHIVDPEQQSVTEGVVVVRNGRIASVSADVPAGFSGATVDLGGRYVLPGLVDTHTHSFGNMSPAGPPQFLGTPGVAQVDLYVGVTAFLDLFALEDAILNFRNAQRDGGQPGAAVFAAGPCLTATNGHCSEYGVPTRIVDSPEDARREIGELAPKRPDVVKIVYDNEVYGGNAMPTVNRETLAAVVAEARAHGLKTVVHIGTWQDVRDAIDVGAAAVTHTPAGPLPDGLPRHMAAAGVYHIPTLAVQSDLTNIVEDPAILDDPLLAAITPDAFRDSYRSPEDYTPQGNSFLQWQAAGGDEIQRSVAALAAAGVPMLTGTDGGNLGVFQGYSVHREIALMVEAGLSTWDALRAATTNAAMFLEQPWGWSPGDEATFIVLDGPPHEDVANTRRIHQVVQRGVVVDRSAPPINR